MPERRDAIDAIDWSLLTDAYGDASAALPGALHDLWSQNAATRANAHNILMDRLGDSSFRGDASSAAVPFLNDLVADDAAPDRYAGLQILRNIAIGNEIDWLVDWPEIAAWRQDSVRRSALTEEQLRAELAVWAADHPDAEVRRSREKTAMFRDVIFDATAFRWIVEAYDAVRVSVPLYVDLLRSPDPTVRLYAAPLLGWFPEERELAVPALLAMLDTEPYAVIADTAVVAAALCGGDDSGSLRALIRDRMNADNPPQRWAACVAAAWLEGHPSTTVLEGLYDCLLEGQSIENWPFLCGNMAGLAEVALERLDPSVAAERVEIAIRRVAATQDKDRQNTLFRAAMAASFGETRLPEGASYATLNDVQ